MNVWDWIIVGILAGIVVLAVLIYRRYRKTGCCSGGSSCSCGGGCSGCSSKGGCPHCKETAEHTK